MLGVYWPLVMVSTCSIHLGAQKRDKGIWGVVGMYSASTRDVAAGFLI